MFDIINKAEFFEWWDRGYADKNHWTLKGIQDTFARAMLKGSKGLRICEVGGGISRVLPHYTKDNECWNIDKMEGRGNGPTEFDEEEGVTRLDAYLGDFDTRLEDESFDVVFSLSVLEHIPDDAYHDCFKDMARILKPGGRMFHAIDIYIGDKPKTIDRVELYRHAHEVTRSGLKWLETPKLPEAVRFRSTYASNPDHQLANWNRVAPTIRHIRERSMNCSIKAAWTRPEA